MPRLLIAFLCAAFAAWSRPLPAQSPRVRPATLLWQVDGSESGDPFGDLRDYVLLKDGTTWALDFKDQLIRRYDARGTSLPTVGRKGSGPGELRNANGLAVAPDGSIWVNDPANGRFSIFTASGQLQRAITLSIGGYGYRWGAWFDPSGELLEPEISRTARFRRVSRDGTALGTIAYPDCSSGSATSLTFRGESPKAGSTMGMYPFTGGGGAVADRRGFFWCASVSGTRVARVPYGKPDTVARTAIEIPRRAVEREERDSAIRRVENQLARYATTDFDRSRVPTTQSGIASLHVDDDGRLWVAHTPVWQQQRSTFDVFDATGVSLFRVTLPVRAVRHLPVVARGNELLVAVYDEDDVISLARYRLQ